MSGRHYGVAGHFTRILVDTYGIETHAAFVAAQISVQTIPQLQTLFEAHTGETLSAIVDQHRADYPRCSDFARTRHLLECAQPPTVPDGNSLRVEFELACDDLKVLGPIDGRMWRTFTIDVTEPDDYEFTNAIGPFDFQLEVVDCNRGCLTEIDDSVQSLGTIFTGGQLSPGRSLIRLSRSVDHPGRAGVDVTGFH